MNYEINAPQFYLSNEYLTDFRYPLHIHKHIEIAFVTSGKLTVQIENNKYELNENELILILPNNAHLYYTDNHSKCQIVVLSDNFANELVDNYSTMQSSSPILKIENIKNLMKEFSVRKPNFYLLKSITNYIAYKYVTNGNFVEKDEKLIKFIHSVFNYIDNNYDKNPTLENLANSLGYTTNYLSSLINSTFNKTFMLMVNEQRIAKAIELLKSSALSITEISYKCGYNTVRSFNRNFLSIVGIAPSEFR